MIEQSDDDGDGRGRVASAVSRVRALDSSPGVVDAVRRIRRALPGDPSFGDSLSTAGPGGARAVARVADRLLDDRPGASREVGLGALQVWQALLERAGRGRGTREMTLVFTDLVGFSDFALAAGDEAAVDLLRAVAKAIEPPVAEHGGQVVKRMGDGMMAVFPRPDRALDAAFAARDALALVDRAGRRQRMRVGVHTGVPRQVGDDWLGVDVNVAARSCRRAATARRWCPRRPSTRSVGNDSPNWVTARIRTAAASSPVHPGVCRTGCRCTPSKGREPGIATRVGGRGHWMHG
ncbi:adenylate cyclase [Rhodococcus triatomae BKS 15-14]|nr:adenylate cyclase [Rhodococcus triatomae BKS 15-14]